MSFLDKYQSIHFVGIGGIGVSALAKFALAHGKKVSGSDTQTSPLIDDLKRRGVRISLGHGARNLPKQVDLVVYTEAADENNPERQAALKRGLKQLGHFGFLGELSKEYRTICVTGTNGKSTTTAMTGLIFEAAGLDPTVFVGSLVPGWPDGNLRVGKSDLLILEGDEYKQKMLAIASETTVITNIEADHLDVYKDLKHIVATFRELAKKTTGKVLANGEDKNVKKLKTLVHETFGEGQGNVIQGRGRCVQGDVQCFELYKQGRLLGNINLAIPGAFNMMNALAATAVALEYKIPFPVMAKALEKFKGIWRRFELVGEYRGAKIISDYGHHPTAIKGTIEAAREFFPNNRLVLLFQPHQHNRTKELFNEFVESLHEADVAIVAEIYGVQGRTKPKEEISSRDLVREVERHMMNKNLRLKNVVYASNLKTAELELRHKLKRDDVIIVMGAGDVDAVARNLVK